MPNRTRLMASFRLCDASDGDLGASVRPLAASLALFAAAFAFASPASAQFTVFGKNKVQYTNFEWHVLHGEHFDLYYYPEEEELAHRTLQWAEDSYAKLAGQFGHDVGRRVPLIIYSSHQAFEQTNVTPYFLPEGVAGLTEFIKGRVLMPFNGSYAQFRTTLHHELVHVFQISINGEAYRKHFRNQLAPVPLWMSEGMADYLSERWSAAGEMILSDLVIEGNLPTIDNLWRYNGTFTIYKLGQRLVGFLVDEYGIDVINRIYDNLWVSSSFAEVLEWVTGDSIERLSARWHEVERRRFYPKVLERESIATTAKALTKKGVNFKAVELPESLTGEERRFAFVSPRTGYTNIYSASLEGDEKDLRTIVRGERDAQYESLHPFQSRLDVSEDGRLTFASKWHDKDALIVYDVSAGELVGRYQFRHIVAITSPAFAPDGERIVFEGLSDDAYSDLYVFDARDESLIRLTNDVYEDTDPDFSPDGKTIVFASDRAEYGEEGAKNLFLLDVESGEMEHLTRGDWVDTGPRFSADGSRVYFSSSREGNPDLYVVDRSGSGRRLTHTLTGVFDASPTRDGTELLFTGYHRGRYHIYSLRLSDVPVAAADSIHLDRVPTRPGWHWDDPATQGKTETARYSRRFSLDFAAGGVAYDPVQADAAGAQIAFTDMLGDEVVYAQLGNTAERGSNLLKRMNLGLSYLNLRRRLNYGFGVFHFAGDFIDERDFVFFERRAGVNLLGSYPFSKFQRLEASLGITYSDKRNESTGIDRRAYLATNFLSWVRDNSLWVATGPVDGSRTKATVGLTLDLPRAEVENFQLIGDYRRYIRAGLRSAWAVRAQGRVAFGSDPRYWTLGGTHTLRGYPRRELFGTRSLLLNNEFRFPLLNGFVIGFPFGAVEFPGVEGAMFVDAGWLWNEHEDAPWPPLGSVGASLRMSFGGFLVFRFDIARRTDFEKIEKRTRNEFFIGWDY